MYEVELLPVAAALTRLEGAAPDRRWSAAPWVDARQCTRARHLKAGCSACADACPAGAIDFEDPETVRPELCTGCGVCAAACPTGVYEFSRPSDDGLMAVVERLAAASEAVAFACPNVPPADAGGAIGVACIGRLDVSMLAGAAAAGMKRIELVDGQCLSCPHEAGRQAAERHAAQANALLQACGVEAEVVFRSRSYVAPVLGEDYTPPDMDEGAALSAAEGEYSPAVTIPKGSMPVRIPENRRRLLDALARLARPGAKIEANTDLWADVTVGSTCTGCRMCAFFCPTGALEALIVDDLPALSFTPALCVNCRLCVEICYTGALELRPGGALDPAAQDSRIVWCNTPSSSIEEKSKRLRMFRP